MNEALLFEFGYYTSIENSTGGVSLVKMNVPISSDPLLPCSGSEYVSEKDINPQYN